MRKNINLYKLKYALISQLIKATARLSDEVCDFANDQRQNFIDRKNSLQCVKHNFQNDKND